jgi:5'-phosphate synthase pdxT subunit
VNSQKKSVGILALQGGYSKFQKWLSYHHFNTILIKQKPTIPLDGLIIPGGESTVILKLLKKKPDLLGYLSRIQTDNIPVLATCAGVVILAKKIIHSNLPNIPILDIELERNGYGSQFFSARKEVTFKNEGMVRKESFIRAPRIKKIGEKVEILGMTKDDPVFIKQGNIIGTTFHPEISNNLSVIKLFKLLQQ